MAFGKKRENKRTSLTDSSVVIDALAPGTLEQDPLEALLDEQSDQEFGDLILKDRERKASGESVKLAEWTARDFSSIYLRFRPHLERHARRFLSNPSQVDEVVQDAFLYLMVSLPELDSEIGVLRFLKWKTRLLALDVIRASGKAYINSIDDVPEQQSKDPEVSSNLEQQDDAAVVKLALSKLNPRHREVLIASMYEEKKIEQIAAQVGLSENATRQLIFRARSAFKKALIGDVDTTGMSAAAILSVAARKAASEGKKVGAAALTLIALVVMSLTVWPTLNGSRNSEMVAGPQVSEANPSPSSNESSSQGSTSAPSTQNFSGETNESEPDTAKPSSEAPAADLNGSEQEQALSNSEALGKILQAAEAEAQISMTGQLISVSAPDVVSATVSFDAEAVETKFSNLVLSFDVAGVGFRAEPTEIREISFVDPDGFQRHVLFATVNFLYDENGKVWTQSELAKATVRIELVMNQDQKGFERALISVLG